MQRSTAYNYHHKAGNKTKTLNVLRKLFANPLVDAMLAQGMRLSFLRFFISKLIPPEYLYTKPSLRNYYKDGIKLKLDISNLVDHFAYFSFAHPGITNFNRFLKPSDTVLDIGANIGYTTLLFSNTCHQGKIISFEPSKKLYATLTSHIGLNKRENITALNFGLGENEKMAHLIQVNESNTGMNRVLEDNLNDFPSESITIKTLDNTLKELDIKTVNAIKLDVEGYEYKVLLGAAETIKKHQPLLLIEIDKLNLVEQGISQTHIFKFLSDHDYNGFDAETMQKVDMSRDYNVEHFDIICFPKTMSL